LESESWSELPDPRVAVVAATGALVLGSALPMLALSVLGSILAGYVLGRLTAFALTWVTDAATGTILQFVGTFGVWIFSDRIGLSSIVTMVVYAITLARSGLSVLVLEANANIGGGARSAELTLPGFVHDVCSAVHPLAAGSPFFKTLPLERFGPTKSASSSHRPTL